MTQKYNIANRRCLVARPDFVVTTERGDYIVLEVKEWAPHPENAGRAIHQMELYKQVTKAAAAIVVVAAGQMITTPSGIVAPIPLLMTALRTLTSTLAQTQSRPTTLSIPTQAPSKRVFASMPFAARYDDTFFVAIQPASLTCGAVAERVDHNGSAGNVVTQIQAMIQSAEAVIADLSDSRPNVLHEVGYAEALGKPIIQICSTSESGLPFNVRNNQTVQYSIGQTAKLRKRLETELAKVI